MKEAGFFTNVFRIVPEFKRGLKISIGVGILYEIIKFIPVIIIKVIVDELVAGQSDATRLMYFIGGVFLAYVALTVIEYFAKRKQLGWMYYYDSLILKRAKKKLLQLHLAYHESFNTGAQVSKISKGSFKLADLSWFIFHEFIPTTIQLVLTFILLLYEQWILGAIFALFLPIIAYITMYTSKEVQPYRRLYHERRDDAIGELGESLFNISTVKDYVQEKKQFHKFERMVADYLHHADKRTRYSFEILKWRDVLITIGRGGTLGIAAYMVLQGTLSAGSLVLVYALTERAFLSTYRIGRLYSYLEDAAEPIERLLQLFATKAMVKDKAGAKSVTKLKGKIEFVQGQFAYGDSKPVLHDINLSVKPKQVVALVGRSGSGKSTMVKLLLRNYDITGGDILIDGHPISKYKIKEYKKRVAVVSQNVEIFNRSVLDNILFANPKATRKDVITAAKKAHAHEFILEFDDGYDTIVGEKGIRLSGGQKQRISIARALLKNPDIYIFDEATSSLDSESEQYIQKSIFAIAGKKTTIIIAHRLSTIKHADVIVVMDKGRIIEQGSYRELIKKKGAFARMIRLQKISEIRD